MGFENCVIFVFVRILHNSTKTDRGTVLQAALKFDEMTHEKLIKIWEKQNPDKIKPDTELDMGSDSQEEDEF